MVFQPTPPPTPATFSSTATPAPFPVLSLAGVSGNEKRGVLAAPRHISDRPAVLILRAFPYPHPTSLCVVRSTAALFFLPSFLPAKADFSLLFATTTHTYKHQNLALLLLVCQLQRWEILLARLMFVYCLLHASCATLGAAVCCCNPICTEK